MDNLQPDDLVEGVLVSVILRFRELLEEVVRRDAVLVAEWDLILHLDDAYTGILADVADVHESPPQAQTQAQTQTQTQAQTQTQPQAQAQTQAPAQAQAQASSVNSSKHKIKANKSANSNGGKRKIKTNKSIDNNRSENSNSDANEPMRPEWFWLLLRFYLAVSQKME